MPVAERAKGGLGAEATLLRAAQAAFGQDLPEQLAVAVSGGSDSLAALHVMAKMTAQAGQTLQAVTVDHALRPEAADEARFVGNVCAQLGVAHSVLRWEHGIVAGNLMDAARRARYGLMAEWARGRSVSHIVLGHTADDQAETFLMGLSREAGLDGLVGMRPSWVEAGARFVRPFLGQERAFLRAYLQDQGQEWIDDPSNANDRFVRVKARRALKALKPLGITVKRLNGVMANLQDAQAALQQSVSEAAKLVCRTLAGEVIFDRNAWNGVAAEVQRRLLIAALRWVAPGDYPPRAAAVARVLTAVSAAQDTTLAGCRLRSSTTEFRVVREPRAVSGLIALPNAIWDGRWKISGPTEAGLEVRALGAAGLRRCKDWRASGISRDAAVTSPAIWHGETLIAAPLVDNSTDWSAKIAADFSLFILSH